MTEVRTKYNITMMKENVTDVKECDIVPICHNVTKMKPSCHNKTRTQCVSSWIRLPDGTKVSNSSFTPIDIQSEKLDLDQNLKISTICSQCLFPCL